VSDFAEHARRYSELGWALIRLEGKVPKGAGWEATRPDPDPEHAAGLWSEWGERWNMGTVLGAANLTVVEFDNDEGRTKLLELLDGELPLTPIVQTGRARLHLYFKTADVQARSRNGLELRAGNQQCVLPPSVHPDTGRAYEWMHELDPWTVPLAELPPALLAYFTETSQNGAAEPIPNLIPIGAIDKTLASLAGSMRRRNASEEAIYAALVETLKRCERGHTHTEADCRRIARSIGRYAPAELMAPPARGSSPERLRSIPLAEVTMRSIEWLEKPLWQRSAFQLLAGPKGAGKGTYIAGLAARVSRAGANVIFVSTEDSASIDLKPRLVAADADIERCTLIVDHVKLPDDIERLRALAEEIVDVGLLVVDPVANHIGDRNSNSDAEVRDAIAPLNRLADDLGCLLIGVRHPGKDRSRGAVASILGSTAWVDTPRAVVMIAPDDEDESLRHIQVVAGNRSLSGAAQVFRIEAVDVPGLTEKITLAVAMGESAKSVDDLLQTRERGDSKSGQARELILDTLDEEGEQESDALDARIAKETGLSARTVQNIRNELKNAGLIRSVPVKDEDSIVRKWMVCRTQAPREAGT
jgi:hypothetical protein